MDIIYLLAFSLSILLHNLFQRYFIVKNRFDEVKERSSHKVLATRSGGSAIFFTIFLITIFLYIKSNQLFDFSLLIPFGILFTVGLYDDIYGVDFKLKFIFQLIVAKIFFDQGIAISTLNGFMGINELPYIASQALTIFFIVFIINATNFSDGIDGLAISETLKCLIIATIMNSSYGVGSQTFLFILSIAVIIPLYYFNFKKDYKVFLGDSGSLFLGGLISVAIIFSINNFNLSFEIFSGTPLIVIICFFYPVVDTTYVTLKRIINKKSPFVADKNHIHHLLIKKGFSHRKTLILISGITGLIQAILLIYSASYS